MSFYAAFAFGLTYLLFTTFPSVYSIKYHFKVGVSGLAFLGMGIGFLLGVVVFAGLSDRILKAQTAKDLPLVHINEETGEQKANSNTEAIKFKPEHRLVLMVYFAPVLPVGFFWYGWAAEKGVHWIVPIIGTSLIGVSAMTSHMVLRTSTNVLLDWHALHPDACSDLSS